MSRPARARARSGKIPTSLAGLRPGARCRVHAVRGGDAVSQRLMEMGLVRGVELEVVRFAPLGDPMQISLLGYHLTIRRSEAERVEVTA